MSALKSTYSPKSAPRKGCRNFSLAYDELLRHRIYRCGTVDATLQDSAIEVCDSTVNYFKQAPRDRKSNAEVLRNKRPLLAYFVEVAYSAFPRGSNIASLASFTQAIDANFPAVEHSTRRGYYACPDDFIWGGVEEFVVVKGSDWCAEVARVFCAFCEVEGLAARVVYALDGSDDGHVLAECYCNDGWMLVDPLAAKLYRDDVIGPVGAARMYELETSERRRLTNSRENHYVNHRFFRFLSIAEYSLFDANEYDYSLSRCNDFYRRRLSPRWN